MTTVSSQKEFYRVFFVHKIWMRVMGLWPLRSVNIFAKFRLVFALLCELGVFFVTGIEIFLNQGDIGEQLEAILFFSCVSICIGKNICFNVNRIKIAITLESVVEDWQVESNEYREITKKYSRVSRVVNIVLIVPVFLCLLYYIIAIIFINTTPAGSKSKFLFPSNWLFNYITDSWYWHVVILQTIKSTEMCIRQGGTDAFFFCVIMHLCSQFEILKQRFIEFGNDKDTEENQRKRLGSLMRRHCELIKRAEYIEDIYNIIILLQLLINSILIGLIGFHTIVSLKNGNTAELARDITIMNFLFLQCFFYTYTSDMLQTHSEEIFYSICNNSWYDLPVGIKKDIVFILIRTNIPFRLTGGKFFYVSRMTLMSILKTAASYVSVLQAKIE